MLVPVRSSQFKRDVRRARARGKDLSKLRVLLESLIDQEPLAARNRDHPLRTSAQSGPMSRRRVRGGSTSERTHLPSASKANHSLRSPGRM